MGRSAQSPGPARRPRHCWVRATAVLRAGLALVLVALLMAPDPALALDARHWRLQDQGGHSWSLTLMEQADPSYPKGLRLRLTARSGSQELDHRRPLRLSDRMGRSWALGNRSQELVMASSDTLPRGSAQFDLADLEPRPRAELPLLLEVPLESGENAELVAGAAVVAALHGDS